MLDAFIQKAKEGKSLWLPDVRGALAGSSEAVPVIFSLTLCTGERVDRCHYLPRWSTPEERCFATEYLDACIFNTLSVYSGQELRFFPRERDAGILELLGGLEERFSQPGLAKAIRLAGRVSRSFGGGSFRFVLDDFENYRPVRVEPARSSGWPSA